MIKHFWVCWAITFFVGFCSISEASYAIKVTVKYPFLSQHLDSLGNEISDSLVRNIRIKLAVFRTGFIDSSSQEKRTGSSGEVLFSFDYWHDGSLVDSSHITRIDISFPTTYEAIQMGEIISFRKLRYESVSLKGRQFEEINIILPLLSE